MFIICTVHQAEASRYAHKQDSRKLEIAWKATPWVTEVHTRRRRGCPRIVAPLSLLAWKAVPDWLSRMTFREVLSSRQNKDYRFIPRTSSFHSYVRGYSWYCLPDRLIIVIWGLKDRYLLYLLGVAPTALTKKHRHSNSPYGLPC